MLADRDAAEAVLACHPGLMDQLEQADRSTICDAAHYGRDAGVALMLDLGFSLTATGDYGGTPLHLAAMRVHADLVRLLLDRGADPNRRDSCYGSTALVCPRWGHSGRPWREVVETLPARGATVDGAWLPDDGPSPTCWPSAGVE
jgi:ankyrin repeat protein